MILLGIVTMTRDVQSLNALPATFVALVPDVAMGFATASVSAAQPSKPFASITVTCSKSTFASAVQFLNALPAVRVEIAVITLSALYSVR